MAFWKDNWAQTRANFERWWRGDGMILSVTAPADSPHEPIEEPVRPSDEVVAWTDPAFRFARAEHQLSRIYFAGDAFPYFDTHFGPGCLALYLGARPEFTKRTVWYRPCIDDLQSHPPLAFDESNPWWQARIAMMDYAVKHTHGRFLVGMPDLIENIDTLAQLRDTQTMMVDLIEEPEAVMERLWQINEAFYRAFGLLHQKIKDEFNGNAFSAFWIWGPGKTAKVQCDAAAMISPAMFRKFVVPPLTAQCDWLDYALFHLDGTQALSHVDALLEIKPLQAIQWTPQTGIETPGHKRWHDLYRRIRSAGKAVQALHCDPEDVIPLLDAVGSQAMFISTQVPTQAAADELVSQAQQFR